MGPIQASKDSGNKTQPVSSGSGGTKNMTVTQENDLIYKSLPSNIMHASDVVKYARTHPDSALHACFDWSHDGEQYRKLNQQAMALIEGVGGRRAEYTKVP
jgi:hypothetical protein